MKRPTDTFILVSITLVFLAFFLAVALYFYITPNTRIDRHELMQNYWKREALHTNGKLAAGEVFKTMPTDEYLQLCSPSVIEELGPYVIFHHGVPHSTIGTTVIAKNQQLISASDGSCRHYRKYFGMSPEDRQEIGSLGATTQANTVFDAYENQFGRKD